MRHNDRERFKLRRGEAEKRMIKENREMEAWQRREEEERDKRQVEKTEGTA